MKRRTVLGQLIIFATISIAVIYYALFNVIGISLTNRPMTVTVQLPTGGGIFAGSEVTYRGVHVGRVTSVTLNRTGVTLKLSINNGSRIASDSTAHVYDLSVVGEQYIDFIPAATTADGGPFLANGSVVPATQTSTPLKTATVLFDLEQWVSSIDPHDVTTISNELSKAFGTSAPELRQIIVNGSILIDELSQSQPQALDLLNQGQTLLDTAAKHTSDFRTFASSLLQLSGTLKQSTPTFKALLGQAAPTTSLVNEIIKDNAASAAVLMSNLATFSSIQAANIPAFRALLVAVPQTGRLVPLVVRNGTIQAGALFNYTQPVCSYGTPLPSPLSASKAPIASVGCAHVVAGELVRGASNAPAAPITPDSGLVVTQSGSIMQLGWDGGQSASIGADSWKSLMFTGVGK
jgi:phospholipid/cholesterol/gamma-HCH transport system substrate-binding protein